MNDFALFVLATMPGFAGAAAWSAWTRPDETWAARTAGAVIAGTAMQAWIGLLLGMVGAIDRTAVIVVALVMVALLVVVLVGARARRARDAGAVEPGDEKNDVATRFFVLACVLALTAIAAAFGWFALASPTGNFDSLAYHLPMLAHWVQHEGLVDPPHLGMHRFFAYGFEVLVLPVTAVLRSDVATALPNLAAWVLLGAGCAGAARALGAGRWEAAASTVVVLTAPVTLGRLDAIQPDLWVGASFVAAWAALLRASRGHDARALTVAVLAAGLMPFMKPSGFAFVAVLLVGAAGLLVRAPARSVAGSYTPAVYVAGAIAAGLGAFWIVRNLALVGNPLGEFEVRAFGVTIFPGSLSAEEMRRTSIAGALRPGDPGDWATLGRMASTMLGAPLLSAVAAAAIGGVVAAVRGARPSRAVSITLVLIVLCVIAYVQMPYGADNGNRGYRLTDWSANSMRYAIAAWGTLGVVTAVGISRLPRSRVVAAVFAVIALRAGAIDVLGLWPRDATAVLVAALVLAAIAVQVRPRMRATIAGPVTVGIVALVVGAAIAQARAPREAAWSLRYGPLYDDLARLLPERSKIAYAVIARPYPLVGMHLGHELVGRDPARDRELWRTDRVQWAEETLRWLDQLQAEGVEVLVVPTRDRFPERDGRAADLQGVLLRAPDWRVLRPAQAPDHFVVYGVRDGRAGSTAP